MIKKIFGIIVTVIAAAIGSTIVTDCLICDSRKIRREIKRARQEDENQK